MEISTMGVVVGGIGIVLLALLIVTAVLHAQTLKLPVRLPNRRAYLAFDPDAYLYSISEGEFSRIAAMVDPSSRKKRLEVHWRYSTPSGKTTHHASRRYSREWVEAYVEQLAGAFKSGQEKLLTLNQLYARALAEGKEVRDEHPTIYCYILPGEESHQGLIKIGYASGSAFKRIANQFKSAAHLEVDYRILTLMPAITITGEKFMDHKVHGLLKRAGIENPMGEWFRCTPEQAERAILAAQMNQKKVSLAG